MKRLAKRRAGWARLQIALALLLAGAAQGQQAAPRPEYVPTYYEFGTVVAVGQHTVDIQTFDESRRKLVQHSFVLSRETRADKVQVGEAVEVIFAQSGTEWTLERLVALTAGMPRPGPPPTPRQAAAAKLPAAGAGTGGSAAAGGAAAGTRNVNLAAGTATQRAAGGEVPVSLGSAAKAKVPDPVAVPLGGSTEVSRHLQPKAREIARDTPSEECNRSAQDWPTRPLSLAVLDFRYPTEREESHDVGETGGGAGTAVADLVFARLESQPEFALSRGDRQKLYRADFAGAARVGRQLGVDAVLAGTFVPIGGPPTADGFPGPRTWELRAGVVDTCTGQLLMRLYSETCEGGAEPGITSSESGGGACRKFTVTDKEAADPKARPAAFQASLDVLLYALEHNGTPAGLGGAAGVVTETRGGAVTIRLAAGSTAKAGDQLSLHAWRLTKNPATYTLENLHDQEIGRVAITSVHGLTAVGSYTGDIPPRPGDTAEAVTH